MNIFCNNAMLIFYKMIVQTVLLYGWESWVLGDHIKNKVNSFHNNQNLLALNINSYMAGATDIWKKANLNEHIVDKNAST